MARQNAETYIGDDYNISVDVVDSAGAAVNIAAASAIVYKANKHPLSDTPAISKSLGSGISIPGTPTNRFTVALAAANTASLLPGVLYHEAEITLGGAVSTVMRGTLTLHPSKT